MRLLVTGGAGFIGSNLCLRASNHPQFTQVVALDDLSTGAEINLSGAKNVDLRVGSILNAELVDRVVAESDVVVHLAAVPSVPRSVEDPSTSFQVNVAGSVTIFEACRKYSRPLILSSSSSVYGQNPILPKVENLEVMPASPYAAHKLSAEATALAYARTYGIPVLALRFFNVYGPNQAPDHAYAAVIPTFLAHSLRGEPVTIHGDGEQTRDFTYIDSVVDVLIEASLNRISFDGPVNLAFGTRTSLNELLDHMEVITNRKIRRVHGPQRRSDVRDSQADHTRLDALFPSISPRSLEEGLRGTSQWMESQLNHAGH